MATPKSTQYELAPVAGKLVGEVTPEREYSVSACPPGKGSSAVNPAPGVIVRQLLQKIAATKTVSPEKDAEPPVAPKFVVKLVPVVVPVLSLLMLAVVTPENS